jgi:hypothetical protein
MTDKELQLRIEQYIEGSLPNEEVDSLWSELIDKPEYREYLETLTNLKKTRPSTGISDRNSG